MNVAFTGYMAILACRNDSSKIAKLAALTNEKHNNFLREFLRVTYEPRINFYMSKIDKSITGRVDATPEMGMTLITAIVENLNGRYFTGNEAKRYVANIYNSFKHDWEREMLEMMIERDVKAGFSESTINKVWADTVTDIPYMRCSLPKDAKLNTFAWSDGVFSQIKADGMFANVSRYKDGTVRVESRNGSPFPLDQLSVLVAHAQVQVPAEHQLHGELLVAKMIPGKPVELLPRQIGNGMLNKVLKGGELPADHVVTYEAWDIIPLVCAVAKGKGKIAYKDRYAQLVKAGLTEDGEVIRLIETRIVNSFEDANKHYLDALSRGLEGTIIKNPTMTWKDGTSKEQVKMKLEFEVDLKVVGYNEGTGKAAGTMGALLCESADGLLKVKVGSGFSDALRDEIWANKNLNIITVKANSIMPDDRKEHHSLFLPIFVEERLDKKTADTLARIQEQFAAAVA